MPPIFFPQGADEEVKQLLRLQDPQIAALADLLDGEQAAQSAYRAALVFAESTGVVPFTAYRCLQLVRYLDSQREEHGKTESQLIEELAAACPDEAPIIARRKDVLLRLFKKKTRGDFFKKRQRLSEGPTKTLKSLWGVCDLRPVFNEERTEVLDTVIVVLARILLEDDRGQEEEIVIQLNEASLLRLEEFIRLTRAKLLAIDKTFEVHHASVRSDS